MSTKTSYKGITIKKMKDGSEAVMVRFKYLGKIYPVKNFTKLYDCRTASQGFDKLQEIKSLIRKNQDPFASIGDSLNDIFYHRLEKNVKNGTWKAKTTGKQYRDYYQSVIENVIGHKKINKITFEDIGRIENSISHSKGAYQNRLKRILNPIFKEALTRREIYVNPLDIVKTKKVEKKEKIKFRSLDDNLTIVRKIYKTIPQYQAQYKNMREELQIFLYLILLTGHRYGELIQLTTDNVYLKHNKIISDSEITKTNEYYEFPIPKECYEYISSVKDGKLFPNLTYGSIYMIFQRLIKKSEIELIKGKKISVHDTRTLMLNIMIKNGIDSMLSDYCLDHKQSGVVEHYLDFDYEDKVRAYNVYWSVIREKS